MLDDILQRHIEQHQPAEEIIEAGFDPATVRRVLEAGAERRVQAQAGAGPEGDRPGVRDGLAYADRGAAVLNRRLSITKARVSS